MLIVALVMAVIGLAALVTAVVTSNEVIAWVCIGASVIGVILLIVDALRERQKRDVAPAAETAPEAEEFDADYPEEEPEEQAVAETADEPAESATETEEKPAER